MAENQNFKCSGDCLKCHPNQRQYCASQFTYNSMRMLEDFIGDFKKLVGTVDELKVKIEAIQGNEASIFDPTNHVSDITQEGDGVIQ